MRSTNEDLEHAKGHSGWLIPLAVFVVTAALCALLLAYYLFPTPAFLSRQPAPTDSTAPVAFIVGGRGFHIPANYIVFAGDRKGGTAKSVDLVALLPDLQGYTLGAAQAFTSGTAESRVVNLTLREEPSALSEEERLERIYLPLVEDRRGSTALYALTSYRFRSDSGYRDQDLFVGDADRQVVLRCGRETPDASFPSCFGDMPLADHVWLSYRFKRNQLEHWREIDSSIRALAGAFMDKS